MDLNWETLKKYAYRQYIMEKVTRTLPRCRHIHAFDFVTIHLLDVYLTNNVIALKGV